MSWVCALRLTVVSLVRAESDARSVCSNSTHDAIDGPESKPDAISGHSAVSVRTIVASCLEELVEEVSFKMAIRNE